MYMSKIVGKTLKKYHNEFNIGSQELLFRTGMFREVNQGVFVALPMGVKVIDNVARVITDKMESIGFQRLYTLDRDFERNISIAVRNDIKSYKELPAFLYDIQRLERDEVRVKDGLVRGKEYIEIRGCSFYEDNESIISSYSEFIKFYIDLFKELGIEVLPLTDYYSRANRKNGHSFIVKIDNGNRILYSCGDCGETQLQETASYYIKEMKKGSVEKIGEIYTPDIKTITELQTFLGVEASDLAKTLLVKKEDEVVAVVLRGDRELNKYKLSKVLGVAADKIQMADGKDIENIDTVTGFVGPIGLETIKIIVDREIDSQGTYIAGANKKDYHIKNLCPSRDIPFCTIADISYIKDKDKCPKCRGDLKKEKGIDVAGMFNMGKMVDINSFNYKDGEGKTNDILGCYHYIDIFKFLSVIVGKYHDENGILWPFKIAPYHVIVSILNTKFEDKVELGKKIYKELKDKNIKIILDERNTGTGSKFKDADLLGIPIRITIGKRADEKIVEFKMRNSEEKEELEAHVAIEKIINILKKQDAI